MKKCSKSGKICRNKWLEGVSGFGKWDSGGFTKVTMFSCC